MSEIFYNKICPSTRKKRFDWKNWMKTLRTYGFNDRSRKLEQNLPEGHLFTLPLEE